MGAFGIWHWVIVLAVVLIPIGMDRPEFRRHS